MAKPSEYPKSMMGIISAIRQTLFEAQDRKRDQSQTTSQNYNPSLDALEPVLDGQKRVLIEPGSVLMAYRASKLMEPFGIRFGLIASGQEWRRPDLIQEINAPFIVPVNFPEIPKLPEDEDWDAVSLDLLRNWDWAPETPALLASQGHQLALTLYSLNDQKQFRKKLKQAIDRGLSKQTALAALTTVPAELCGLSESMGTLVSGKLANFSIIKGDDYFSPENTLESTWVEGRRYPNVQFEPDSDETSKDKEKKEDAKRNPMND
jgi:hypothetical protein